MDLDNPFLAIPVIILLLIAVAAEAILLDKYVDVTPQMTCSGQIAKGSIQLIPVGCSIIGDVATANSSDGPWHDEWIKDPNQWEPTVVIVVNQPTWIRAQYEAKSTSESLVKIRNGLVDMCRTRPHPCMVDADINWVVK